jgi:hypothetical protein
MDNLNSDMAWKPNPPGGEAFVVRHFNTYLDCAGSMSTMTMTNPPSSGSPSDKQCVSFSVATKYGGRNCNNNDKDSTADFCSNDQLPRDSDTLSSGDELFKSMAFPQHSFMAKYIHEYATMKGFCLWINIKSTSPARSSVNPLPSKAMITHWNQIQIKIRNIQEGDIIVAPANLMAISRD